jgi:hypothetical protein
MMRIGAQAAPLRLGMPLCLDQALEDQNEETIQKPIGIVASPQS